MSKTICNVCGFENESGAVVCAECGNVLNSAESNTQYQQQAPQQAPQQQYPNQQYGYQQQYANPQYQQYPNQQYGYQQQYANPQYQQYPNQQYGYQQQYPNQPYQKAYAPNDAPSTGIAIASFFIPLLGLILYLTWNNTYPQKAKSAGKGALIGFIVNTVVSILITVIMYGVAYMM